MARPANIPFQTGEFPIPSRNAVINDRAAGDALFHHHNNNNTRRDHIIMAPLRLAGW